MPLEVDKILVVAQTILDRLGHNDATWTVIDAAPAEAAEPALAASGLEPPRTVLVRAAKATGDTATISAFFVLSIPTQQAIMQLASSLQDEVIEKERAAVPRCPAHPHPLTPRLENDRAVWACPFSEVLTYPIDDTD